MNKHILLEIQKLKYLSTYNRGLTMTENAPSLLLEQWGSFLKHVPGGRIAGKTLIELTQQGSQAIFNTFRKEYGDQFIDEIAAKIGKTTKGVEDLLYRSVKAGDTLTLKESNVMIEQLSKNSEGYRKVMLPILQGDSNMVLLKNAPDELVVKMLDDKVKYGLDGFSDDFISEVIDVNVLSVRRKLIQQSEKSVEDLKIKKKETKISNKKKAAKEKLRLKKLKADALKVAEAKRLKWEQLRAKIRAWGTKAIDLGAVIGGTALMAATVGPLTAMLAIAAARFLVRMGAKVLKSIFHGTVGKKTAIAIERSVKKVKSEISNETGYKGTTPETRSWMDRKLFEPTTSQYKRGARQVTQFSYVKSATFWRGAAIFYLTTKLLLDYFKWPELVAKFIDADYMAFFSAMITDPSGRALAALEGKFSGEDQDIINVDGLSKFGYEFNTVLVEETADSFHEAFSPWMGSIAQPYQIWPFDIDEANDYLKEFVEAAPNLLFVSMVSDKHKEKYGESLWKVISNYSANLDAFGLQWAGETIYSWGKYAVNLFTKEDLGEFKAAVDRKPDVETLIGTLGGMRIIDAELDELIVQLYDYVAKGVSPTAGTGPLGDMLDQYELSCEEKKKMLDDSIGEIYAEIIESGMERLTSYGIGINNDAIETSTEYDCMSGKYNVQVIQDLTTLKTLDKLFNAVPVQGETYFVIDISPKDKFTLGDDALEETISLTTHANKDAIPHQTRIAINPQATIEQLVGKTMSLDPNLYLKSGDRSIAYYVASMNPKLSSKHKLKVPYKMENTFSHQQTVMMGVVR